MKDIGDLKRETDEELRAAREHRLDRQAKERRDGPILNAFDRMSRGEPVEHTPGPRHAPQLLSMPPSTRVVHCKREKYDVYIGRPSKWGNPFKLETGDDRDAVIARYEKWLRSQPQLIAALGELSGKVLGCWCAPKSCHGDVLARLADEVNHG